VGDATIKNSTPICTPVKPKASPTTTATIGAITIRPTLACMDKPDNVSIERTSIVAPAQINAKGRDSADNKAPVWVMTLGSAGKSNVEDSSLKPNAAIKERIKGLVNNFLVNIIA